VFRRAPGDYKGPRAQGVPAVAKRPVASWPAFKRIHASEPLYSARVSLGWRVVGLLQGDTMHWFWIGSHADYDRLLRRR
jgi:hypothetical protein